MERTPMSAKSQGIFSSAVTDDEFGMVYYHYGPPHNTAHGVSSCPKEKTSSL